ncbi:MAG: Aldehyde dehydrogenase [Candidatus Solibacter sp.]|jgi:aldehyde dehydrogenase (NAD+)|nr:Aldehyde dehydrogenase [Candidatus Solibacter sp.]
MLTQTQQETNAAANRPTTWSGFDRQYVNGAWRTGRSSRRVQDVNPFTGETILEIPSADQTDLDEAYHSAAGSQPSWASALPSERAEVMRRAAGIMEVRRSEFVDWLVRESGSTRLKAEIEWQFAQYVILEASSMPHRVKGAVLPGDIPGKECRVYRKPVGVVGVISPWNWPLQLSLRSVAPALAVGNGVVLKPSSDTPITGGLILGKLFEEAGLPPGVLNVLVGAGSEIGDAFVRHATPRVISFTGSTAVGRQIASLSAESAILKRLELELGGNTPFVVLDDADLDYAADAAAFGRFFHQGQICMSVNRVIVDDSVFQPFLDRFVARVRSLKYGDPGQPDTFVGPIINRKQLEHLQQHIRAARDSGMKPLLDGDPQGLVLPPHVFADVPNDHPLAKDELFGPVAPVIRARGEDDALRLANATEYGLSSAVITRDGERGVRFANRIEAGMAHVNDQPVNDLPNNPFGGEKNSGIGRFGGDWAIAAFTTDQWLTVQHQPRRFPWDARELSKSQE